MTSLAELKRAIATPGTVIRVINHWQSQLINTTRSPKVVRNSGRKGIQGNGYYFDGLNSKGEMVEMWAETPKAAELRFNADGSVTYFPNTDRPWTLQFSVGGVIA